MGRSMTQLEQTYYEAIFNQLLEENNHLLKPDIGHATIFPWGVPTFGRTVGFSWCRPDSLSSLWKYRFHHGTVFAWGCQPNCTNEKAGFGVGASFHKYIYSEQVTLLSYLPFFSNPLANQRYKEFINEQLI